MEGKECERDRGGCSLKRIFVVGPQRSTGGGSLRLAPALHHGMTISSSSYFIFQHNIKQMKIITVEYKNMPEGCQRSKRSLNWPPILLYD